MSLETADYLARQKSKIRPLVDSNPTVHIHTRKRCVVCREARKQRKHETEKATLELGGTALQELIKGSSYVLGQTVRSLGLIGRGIAENNDPITQGVTIAGGVLLLAWFISAHPTIAHLLGLESLSITLPGKPFDLIGGLDTAIAKLEAAEATFAAIGVPPPGSITGPLSQLRQARDLASPAQQLTSLLNWIFPEVGLAGLLLQGKVDEANKAIAQQPVEAVRAGPFDRLEEAQALAETKQAPKQVITGQFDHKYYVSWTA